MRKILFAVVMAAGVGLIGTSAMAAPAAPMSSNGLTNSNVEQAQYYGYRRHRRSCTRVRVCDGYGYCRWRTRCW